MLNAPKDSDVTFYFSEKMPYKSLPICETKDGKTYKPEYFSGFIRDYIINEFAPAHNLTESQGKDFLMYLCEQGEQKYVDVPGKWLPKIVDGTRLKVSVINFDEELTKHIPNFRATEKQRAEERMDKASDRGCGC